MTEQVKMDFDNAPQPPLKLRGGDEGGGVMTDREQRLLALIQRGRENAISMPALAAAVEVPTRELQQIIQHLINDHGVLIASATGKNHGYYYPENAIEFRAAAAQLEHRIISLAKRLRAINKVSYEEIFGQGRIFDAVNLPAGRQVVNRE